MPKIAHVSLEDFMLGKFDHFPIAMRIDDDVNSLPDTNHPTRHSYSFEFKDGDDPLPKHISSLIVDKLKECKERNEDVLVHCQAGIARSAAVAQFAMDYLEFEDANDHKDSHFWRKPNLMVYASLVKAYKPQSRLIDLINHDINPSNSSWRLNIQPNPEDFPPGYCYGFSDLHAYLKITDQLNLINSIWDEKKDLRSFSLSINAGVTLKTAIQEFVTFFDLYKKGKLKTTDWGDH